MKNLKLFTKIFLYTFLVMLFVTVMAHVFLYVLAPQMTVSTNRFVEGAIIESAVNTGILIKSAIGKALPVSLLCCAIISAGCSLLFSRAMTRPIKQIAETTEKMEKLDKAAICVVHTKDEIGELAARVNKLYASLLSTIENLEEEKQNVREAERSKIDFLRAASHELKTPLTVILSSADLLRRSAAPEQEAYIDNIQAESRRMRSLVEDMLTLFRAQKSAGTLPDTTADVSETAVTAALRFEPVAFEAGHLLEYDIAPGLSARGDGARLGQALAVLLDNAVKYAAPGTPIQLDAVRQGSRAVLTVTNRGEDIPADKLPHIFDRFYRADEARTDGSSFGLGLAIAKAIVDAHRGTIRCESGGGVTRFIISLPLAAGKQERGTDHV